MENKHLLGEGNSSKKSYIKYFSELLGFEYLGLKNSTMRYPDDSDCKHSTALLWVKDSSGINTWIIIILSLH